MTTIKYSSTPAINRHWRRLLIAAILSLAALLYFYQLGTESLWIDEIYSVYDAQNFNLDPKISRPLYFLLLQGWMQFGTSDAWLRGLGVVFGLGSIGLLYWLGRRLAGETTGLIAALMLTLSPLFINHAQEVRMYTLSTFLGLGGTLALTYTLQHLRAFSLCVWAIARVLAILTTPLNVTLLLPDIVVFGLHYRHRRRAWFALGVGLLLIGILWLPVAFHLATSSGPAYMSGEGHSNPSLADVLLHPMRTFTVFFDSFNLKPLKVFFPPVVAYFYHAYSAVVLGLLVVAVVRVRSSRLLWVAAWAFLPAAAILLISYIFDPIWLPRYLLMVVPYLLILIAAGFGYVWTSQRRVALAIALIYSITVGGGLLHYYTTSDREDWRSVGQTITKHEQPGDQILVSGTNSRPLLGVTHYYHGTAPVELLGDFSRVKKEQREQELAERLRQRLATDDSRFWLVVKLGNSDNRQQITQIVEKEARPASVQTYKSIEQPVNLFLITHRQEAGSRGELRANH